MAHSAIASHVWLADLITVPHLYVVLHIYPFRILFSNGCLSHLRVSGGFASFRSRWSQVMFFLRGNSYDCLHPAVYPMTACHPWLNSSV